MPAHLILMNPSRPGSAHRARLGDAVKRALAAARNNPANARPGLSAASVAQLRKWGEAKGYAAQRKNPLSARQIADDAKKARFIAQHGIAAFRAKYLSEAEKANKRAKATRAAQRAMGGSNAQIEEALRAKRIAAKQRTEKRNAAATGMSLSEYRAWARAQTRKNPHSATTARQIQKLHDAGVPASVINRMIGQFSGSHKAAGLPRTNPQEKHMAHRRRSNPTKKGNPTKAESLAAVLKALNLPPAQLAAIMGALAPGRRAPKVWAPGEKAAAAKAARARAIAKAGGAEGWKRLQAESRATKYGVADQTWAAFRRGEISIRDVSRLSKLGTKLQRRRIKSSARKVMRPATRASAYAHGARHIFAQQFTRKEYPKGPAKNLAKSYLSAKKFMILGRSDPLAMKIAKTLGLSGLPNGELQLSLPIVALTMGGVIAVGLGVSKILPMVVSKVGPGAKKWVLPGLALGVGIGGSLLMKKYPGIAKFSGAVLAGGAAIAALAIVNMKDASGASFASKNAPALALGDYHMGLTVGDYHMGDVAQLNVGDYHMGAIAYDNARRQLAPPGQPMPRHDTRRDGVDSYIDQFNGTLAGDMFDA